MGFRYEWEPVDERPCIVYTEPFWESRLEEATYEAAIAGNPRREGEGPMAYVARISGIVTGEREQLAKSMPRLGLSRRARDLRLQLLRSQESEVVE